MPLSRGIKRKSIAVLLAAAVLLPSACSDGGEDSADDAGSIFTYEGADRDTRLADGAKTEGAVTWYTTTTGPIIDELTKAFESKNPGVKVTVFRAAQTEIVARVLEETKSKKVAADVFSINTDAAQLLGESNVLAPFFSPYAEEVDERWKFGEEGKLALGVGYRNSIAGFMFNTDKMPESSVPDPLEWRQLADPQFRGKFAWATSTTGVRAVGNVLHAYGEDEGKKLIDQIARNGVRFEAAGGAGLSDMVGTGEVTATPTVFHNQYLQAKAAGSHVGWRFMRPDATSNAGVVSVPKAAPHPNAAMLFADFMLSQESMDIHEKYYQYPPSWAFENDVKVWIPDEDYKSVAESQKAFDGWQSLFEQMQQAAK